MFASIDDFKVERFASTKWEKAEQKVRFARQFIKFVESDFAMREFPHAFYLGLSLTFGHIAHYNQGGFFGTFFTTTEDKVRFLSTTLKYECYGDAAYTYSDVERALQAWLRQNGILKKYEQRLSAEQEAEERAELSRLQAKYEGR